MRPVLLFAVIGLLLWSPAAAQIDEVLLFSDSQYNECSLFDKNPGPVSVYVVHRCGGGRGGAAPSESLPDFGEGGGEAAGWGLGFEQFPVTRRRSRSHGHGPSRP